MLKKALLITTVLLVSFVITNTSLAASNYTLDKQTWVENHFDAKIFNYNDQICAAGPYGNEIRTNCLNGDTWEEVYSFVQTDAEYIDLEKVFTWQDQLFYVIRRGLTGSSNNDSHYIEIWLLNDDDTWGKVFSYTNPNVSFEDVTYSNKRIYFFISDYTGNDTKVFYYTSKDGENWNKAKRKNTPNNVSSAVVVNKKLYISTYDGIYERRSTGYWKKRYSLTNGENESSSIAALTSFKNKLYIVLSSYVYTGEVVGADTVSDFTYTYKVLSSKNAKTWTSKKITDKSFTQGAGVFSFYTDSNKLWLLASGYGKKRNVLWRIPTNVRKINTSKHKRIIPKTSKMKTYSRNLNEFMYYNNSFYFADSYGNIYTNK